MSNRRNIQFTYNPHNKGTLLDCSFIVDSANGNGFGIRSLKKSGRISSVFMHTSQTPGTASNGLVNPNPASGLIMVNLQDNYNAYLGGFSGQVSPLSGSNISSGMSAGNVYVITVLGNTTLAQWQVAGLPKYITPAVGVSFIALATSFTGTGRVQALAAAGSGIDHLEVVGDSNLANSNGANVQGFGVGMQIILACFGKGLTMASYTPAGVITNGSPDTFAGTPAVLTGTVANALAAPADNTVIGLSFYMNDSAQGV